MAEYSWAAVLELAQNNAIVNRCLSMQTQSRRAGRRISDDETLRLMVVSLASANESLRLELLEHIALHGAAAVPKGFISNED